MQKKNYNAVLIILAVVVLACGATLVACTSDKHVINFVADGVTVKSVEFKAGSTSVAEPQVPSKEGYNGSWQQYTLGTADITVNAVYTPIEYTISFFNVENAVNENPSTYNVETGLLTLQPAVKQGFNFDGWFSNEDCAETHRVTEIAAGSVGDVELWASWTQLPYTLSSDGKTIDFGSYPQTLVKDAALESMLNAEIGNARPSAEDAAGWTDYGFYWKNQVESYTWYLDKEYNGERYRAVYFTKYRGRTTSVQDDHPASGEQSGNGYQKETVYWFKWEPISWQVLEKSDTEAFVISWLVLDATHYYHSTTADGAHKLNNYMSSDIRTWLNNEFYNAAFQSVKPYVKLTEVDNSAATTSLSGNPNFCENTNDYVFLPSYQDVKDGGKYGFTKDSRKREYSDYAACMGLSCDTQYGWWWTRSPNFGFDRLVNVVRTTGTIETGSNQGTVNIVDYGVMPEINIILAK